MPLFKRTGIFYSKQLKTNKYETTNNSTTEPFDKYFFLGASPKKIGYRY